MTPQTFAGLQTYFQVGSNTVQIFEQWNMLVHFAAFVKINFPPCARCKLEKCSANFSTSTSEKYFHRSKVCCSSIIPSVNFYNKSRNILEYLLQILQIDGTYTSTKLCDLDVKWIPKHPFRSLPLQICITFLPVKMIHQQTQTWWPCSTGGWTSLQSQKYYCHDCEQNVWKYSFCLFETVVFISCTFWIAENQSKNQSLDNVCINYELKFFLCMMQASILPSIWTKDRMLTIQHEKISFVFHWQACVPFLLMLLLQVSVQIVT